MYDRFTHLHNRAMIFKETGDSTMAIINFTQAIKLNKDDYQSHFQRAEMYEKVRNYFYHHSIVSVSLPVSEMLIHKRSLITVNLINCTIYLPNGR